MKEFLRKKKGKITVAGAIAVIVAVAAEALGYDVPTQAVAQILLAFGG